MEWQISKFKCMLERRRRELRRRTEGWTVDAGKVYGSDRAVLEAYPRFIPAAPKSRTRENANPKREHCVFGSGPEGWGYYRLDTDAADAILAVKLANRLAFLERKIAGWGGVARCDERLAAAERRLAGVDASGNPRAKGTTSCCEGMSLC